MNKIFLSIYTKYCIGVVYGINNLMRRIGIFC